MILYIGNKLSRFGKNPTSVETLGPLLGKYYTVKTISDKKNKVLRMLHIVYTLLTKKRSIEVVLIDTYSTSAFYFAVVSARICFYFSIPYILILRGGNLANRLHANHQGQAKKIFSNAFKLVAPSPFLYDLFKAYGFTNLIYIPNNLVISNYQFKERKTVAGKLLWVRAFQGIYNPTMAIAVYKQLKEQFPLAELCMVGPDKDGSLTVCREYTKNLGLENQVIFKGKLSKEEWHALAEQYDVFLNTTTVDNTPISVMEAMALGLPVVSTNVGGIPFLLTNDYNALLVDNNDTDGMIMQIKRLLNDVVLVNTITVNAKSTVEKYDWERIKEDWFSLLENAKLLRKE